MNNKLFRHIVGFLSLSIVFFVTVSSSLASQSVSPKKYKVIIIGAGISGLSAAKIMKENNIPFLVLEGRNRIGGRLYTVYPWGVGLDLGATWIHCINQNPIAEMVSRLKLETVPTAYNDNILSAKFKSFTLYDADGKRVPATSVSSLSLIVQQFDDYVLSHPNVFASMSMADAYAVFAKQIALPQAKSELLRYMINNVYLYEYAADMPLLSAQSGIAYLASPVSGPNVLFPGGYNQILPPLVKNVPMELNQKVTEIDYRGKTIDIYTENEHYQADYVIVTVPVGVLQSGAIRFTPALPDAKQHAIKQLRMGVYDKIYLLFDKPFWDKDSEWIGYMPAKNQTDGMWDIMNYYKVTGVPALLVFTSGSLAENVEQWLDKDIVHHVMAMLKKIYGDAIPEPSSYVITRWNDDPFSKGSYSYLPVGASMKNYQLLAQPVANRLFFAGEATSTQDPATVHGAYLSGIRAAKEVMKVASVKQQAAA